MLVICVAVNRIFLHYKNITDGLQLLPKIVAYIACTTLLLSE